MQLLHEDTPVDDPPAKDEARQIACRYIFPVPEDRDGTDTGLLFYAVLQLVHHMGAQFAIYYQFSHSLAFLPALLEQYRSSDRSMFSIVCFMRCWERVMRYTLRSLPRDFPYSE